MSDSGSCEPCPAFTSSAAGASACGACAVGYFRRMGRAASTANCEACPVGAVCPWNTTVKTLQVQLGYWRLSPYSTAIEPCDGDNTTSPCVGGGSEGICAAGFLGPRCTYCSNSSTYYDSGVCATCPNLLYSN